MEEKNKISGAEFRKTAHKGEFKILAPDPNRKCGRERIKELIEELKKEKQNESNNV